MGFRWTYQSLGISGNLYEAQLIFDTPNANATAIYNTGASPLVFGTNGTERARIDGIGNFQLGTTAGSAKLTAYKASGDVLFADTISGTGYVYRCGQNSATAAYFITSAGQAGLIQCTGNSTNYASGSDYRLKDNVRPLIGALEKVAALKPVAFEWKSNGEYSESFIAHELQETFPHAVNGEKDGVETYMDEDGNEQTRPVYQGIDTSFLVATLTAAIQEQQAIIEQLRADVEVLKAAA